jgi:hypothetical protein
MKKALLLIALILTTSSVFSQNDTSNEYALYPLDEVKNGYDSNLNPIYSLKLVNRSKLAITHIVFRIVPTWLDGDTQLMRALRAEKTYTVKRQINIKSRYSINCTIDRPDKYALEIALVRYADGSVKEY